MQTRTVTPSATGLKALAHPVRLRLLGMLRADGPSTATVLAQRLGLNSGATSYHLRQLAEHGFVEDDPQRGNGRERWWRAAHQATRTWQHEETQEQRDATDAFAQAIVVVQTERLQRAVEERPLLPEEWREASMLSDWALRLTPRRAQELRRALDELVTGWAEEDDAEAEDFVVVVNTFPRPGRVEGEAER